MKLISVGHEVVLNEAIEELQSNIRTLLPKVSGKVFSWMNQLSDNKNAINYFTHQGSFPFLQLPWFLESQMQRRVDARFQRKLAISSISGYYFTRLNDNIMDGEATSELNLLPVNAFFAHQFQFPYYDYFPVKHEFWLYFENVWAEQSESTIIDDGLDQISKKDFSSIVSKKVGAAKIPVAAVCHLYGKKNEIPRWESLIDKLAMWHLLQQDIFDWAKDIKHGKNSYFISEGNKRISNNISIYRWVLDEGFKWGFSLLKNWMKEIIGDAEEIKNQSLNQYLEDRNRIFLIKEQELFEKTEMLLSFTDESVLHVE